MRMAAGRVVHHTTCGGLQRGAAPSSSGSHSVLRSKDVAVVVVVGIAATTAFALPIARTTTVFLSERCVRRNRVRLRCLRKRRGFPKLGSGREIFSRTVTRCISSLQSTRLRRGRTIFSRTTRRCVSILQSTQLRRGRAVISHTTRCVSSLQSTRLSRGRA